MNIICENNDLSHKSTHCHLIIKVFGHTLPDDNHSDCKVIGMGKYKSVAPTMYDIAASVPSNSVQWGSQYVQRSN